MSEDDATSDSDWAVAKFRPMIQPHQNEVSMLNGDSPPLMKREDVAISRGVTLAYLDEIEKAGIVTATVVGKKLYYNAAQQLRIEVVLKGRRLGFSLDEIKRILADRTRPARRTDGG